ncbi:DUF262 domain-containing protein [Acinetobacter sp. ANC 4178]|uniref:GmrSD restriction endonuclease domain-containing protein n=1 Tax=Acinetobacter sp. ANC 4178 TaxID=2529839 RepID=UPI001040808C|nr:DUF262 domain-containing protein [Acinetobacter sp. ANC 4178]TCB65876.1 DUF262 domain-containing protein [Acinetobacter sp. ANC 4178]
MEGNLSIKGIPVLTIYSQCVAGKFIINRRYQRKLVWSIEEKEKFIDSLLNGFPIPMIIAANYRKSNDENAFEILDGMQRLNAIISFIECEFSVNGKYFNLETVAQTKSQKESSEILQKEPVLDIDSCAKVLDYPVPFSVCDNNNSEKVDESFRRINTGGRTLSKQDVRQAGALGQIPDLIRDCSIYIRKDSSHSNIVDLRNMRNISLSNKGLGYGIDLHGIFWSKHGIITTENIRMSRDEELVAHLVSYIINPNQAQTTSKYLDAIYDSTSQESESLNIGINKKGYDPIYKQFCFVFEELKKTLDTGSDSFRKLVFKESPAKTTSVFQVVYIAFYKALITHNLQVANYLNLRNSLENLFDMHLKALDSDLKWSSQDREKLSESIYGVIKLHFKPKSGTDRYLSSWVESLENILNESKTEQVCYDFKMGLHQISDGSGKFHESTVDKIVKTLTAMTNSKAGDCFVVLGVADNENAAKTHKKHYNSEYLKYNDFCIVGIESEAVMYQKSIENYEKKILQLIAKQPISEKFKQVIKSNIVTFTYNNREILLFKAFRSDNPERYNGDIYKRNLSHLEIVDRDSEFDFLDLFRRESNHAQI